MDAENKEPLRDISTFFGLTYSSYLVLPRLLLENIPAQLQHEFVELMDRIEAVHPMPGFSYRVTRINPVTGKFMPDPFSGYRRGDIHAALASVDNGGQEATCPA
ncbi:MAG: hypothetical protein FD177_258 [Desulfovibrionaceae bacterium]|nr:MAG: hypothetical protein FD177_258 [Desulfovibrionaceae bacterium]